MSTLSVHRLENVQDFDMANTPFTTAFNAANSAFAVTNAAFNTTNTAFGFANSVNTFAYGVAVNAAAAFAAANNVAPQVTPAFLTGNLAYSLANTVYASVNSNWTVTNTVYGVANAAYGAANNVGPQIAPTYNTANAAYGQANAAYAAANTKFSSSGGTISGAVEITADLTVHGNTRFIDQTTLSVGDPLIYLAANNYASDVVDIGFIANYVNTGGANVHTGLYRSSGTKEYYLFYGYDKEPLGNYIDPTGNNITKAILNADIRTSNLILGGANTINWITSNYNTTNASFGVSNAAFGKANNALANTTGSLAGNLTVAGGSITGASQSTYALSLGNVGGSSGDIAFGSDASYGYVQSWNGKPLCINNQGNNVGIGGAPSYKLHVAGTGYASSDFRAPIFYDSDNTAYYSDPHATSNFNALNILNGYFNNTGLTLQLGAGISTTSALGIGFNATDTNYAIYKPAGAWTKPLYIYFYTGIRNYSHSSYDYGQSFWNISTGNLMASFGQGDNHTRINYNLYAPIMYDLDNTGYYVDPNSTSHLRTAKVTHYKYGNISYISKCGAGCMMILQDGELYTASGTSGGTGNQATGRGLNGQVPVYGLNNFKAVTFPNEAANPIQCGTDGFSRSWALFANGNLYTWGQNPSGQMGVGNSTAYGFPTLSTTNVTAVYDHPTNSQRYPDHNKLIIRKTDGYLYATGYNAQGNLGVGDTTVRTSWTQLTALGTNILNVWNMGATWGCTVVQKTDHTIWVCGFNNQGMLGNGNTTQQNSFINVTTNWGGGSGYVLTKVIGGFGGWNGGDYGEGWMGMLLDNGTTTIFRTSGRNSEGQLGDGTTTARSTPITPNVGTGRIADVASFGDGAGGCLVLKADGNLYTWGYNGHGQLGNGTTTNNPTPTINQTGVAAILSDGCVNYVQSLTAATFIRKTADNALYCTGYNANAQLGVGDTTNRSTYTKVRLPSDFVVSSLGWMGTTYPVHTFLALSTDGRLYAWGYNAQNSLAADSTINGLTPHQITPFLGG